MEGGCGPGVGNLGVGRGLLRIAYIRSRRKGIAYARYVATQLDAVKLHLTGAQHGARNVVGIDARAGRNGRTIIILAINRYLADEVLTHHGVGNGERLFVAYDLSVIGDVAARLNRTREPGVGPGAGVGNGLSRSAVPIVLDLIVHICPECIARVERARLRGIRVVLILGILNEDLCLTGKRCGGRGGNGVLLLRSNRRRSRILRLSHVVCSGVIAIRGTRSCTLICVGAIVSSARRRTVRAGVGSSAIVGRRALASRRSSHGLGNALGAVGPKLRRRSTKSHGKS